MKRPDRVGSIVIVGATCSGKTTLVQAIRDAALDGVDIPRRFVTRAPRPDDVADEATRLIDQPFHVHWTRTLEPGRIERYAFAPHVAGKLPVYSANNAILDSVQPAGVLDDALIVGIFAPDDVREQRLQARSPGLFRDRPDEARARLAERMSPNVHVVIENHGKHEERARHEIVDLVLGTLRALT